MELREYQDRLLDGVDNDLSAGAKAVLAVSPTGSGKTVTFSKLVGDQQQPTLVMVHRTELVSQISMTLARWGVSQRLIAPAETVRSIRAEHFREFKTHFDNPQSIYAVASVDTLLARAEKYADFLKRVGLWITDEAAHVLADNKWGRCITLCPNAVGVGFTATPKRADGKGLGRINSDGSPGDGVFDTMVLGPSTAQLIAMGNLSRYKIIAKPSDLNVSDVKVTATGDYSGKDLRAKSHQSHIVGDVVNEYKRHASGKQGITFTVDVETANELAAQFRAAGVPAASVSAESSDHERASAVRAFRNGELRQLTNCDLFGEGFDVPGVEVVSLARPTMSLSLHLQQVGRALRPAPGKDHALIIDHVGNWERHGLPDSPRSWSLDPRNLGGRRKVADDSIPLTTCLACFLVFERRLLPVCPHCGERRDPDARRKPEQVDGDLNELDADVLAALREQVELATPQAHSNKVRHAAGNVAGKAAFKQQTARIEAQRALQHTIAMWAGVRKRDGFSDSASYREFYLQFGVDVLTAQTLNTADMNALRERIEGKQDA